MPNIYENEIKEEEILSQVSENQFLVSPRILGQSARESFVDYANPREKIITIFPGSTNYTYQLAIDELNRRGGGTLFLAAGTHYLTSNLSVKAFVEVRGEGVDKTIINFGANVAGLVVSGSDTRIRDFTITNSAAAQGIDFLGDRFFAENILVDSSTGIGFFVEVGTDDWTMTNLKAYASVGSGFKFSAGNRFFISHCTAEFGSGIGFEDAGLVLGTMIGCRGTSNAGDDFDFSGSSATAIIVLGCYGESGNTFDFDVNKSGVYLVNCQGVQGSRYQNQSCVIGGSFSGVTSTFTGTNVEAAIIGVNFDAATGTPSVRLPNVDMMVNSYGNLFESFGTQRIVHSGRNSTASTMVLGETIVLAFGSGIEDYKRTTTYGDSAVCGMALETGDAGARVRILHHGYTNSLRVDGTTDIAIGDFLTPFSTSGVAAKARDGDMVFAIALEAYTTDDSNGVIDAYIFPWRFPLISSTAIPTSGTYNPQTYNVANLDSSSAVYTAQYLRVGNTVTVSGRVDVNPTSTATSTSLGIDIPIASNFSNSIQCCGVAFASAIAGQGAAILSDEGNNRAELKFISGDVTDQPMYYTFTYQII